MSMLELIERIEADSRPYMRYVVNLIELPPPIIYGQDIRMEEHNE